MTGSPRTAGAAAKGRVQALMILKADFDRIRKKSPHLDEAARVLASNRIDELRVRNQKKSFENVQWAQEAAHALRQGTEIPTAKEIQAIRKEHSGAPLAVWLGILLDGIPESFVIGSGFLAILTQRMAETSDAVSFSAIVPYTLIAGLFLSNFPEAMSSSVGMSMQGLSKQRIFWMWFSLMVITSLGSGLGFVVGENMSHSGQVFIEGIAAGAMLTMIASTMLPEAVYLGGRNSVGISTLMGFLAAIAFKLIE